MYTQESLVKISTCLSVRANLSRCTSLVCGLLVYQAANPFMLVVDASELYPLKRGAFFIAHPPGPDARGSHSVVGVLPVSQSGAKENQTETRQNL